VVRQTVGVRKAPRSDTTRDDGLASNSPRASDKRTAKQSVVGLRRSCLEKAHLLVAGLGVLCLTCSLRGRKNAHWRLRVLAPVPAGVEGGALQHEVGGFSAAVIVAQVGDLELTIDKLLPLLARLDDTTRNCRVPIWVHFWQTLATFIAAKVIVVALVFVRLQVELKG
jgi:hypothetical protein